jgi:hypothetical protein
MRDFLAEPLYEVSASGAFLVNIQGNPLKNCG